MKQVIKAGGGVLLLLSLVDCLQINTLIKVKPDGSGTIEETFLISKEFVQLIKEMTEQMVTGLTEQGGNQSAQKSTKKQAEEFFDKFNLSRYSLTESTMNKSGFSCRLMIRSVNTFLF